jgi:hypothetical protein
MHYCMNAIGSTSSGALSGPGMSLAAELATSEAQSLSIGTRSISAPTHAVEGRPLKFEWHIAHCG